MLPKICGMYSWHYVDYMTFDNLNVFFKSDESIEGKGFVIPYSMQGECAFV